jgi:periplasmic protein CpxP/Spy
MTMKSTPLCRRTARQPSAAGCRATRCQVQIRAPVGSPSSANRPRTVSAIERVEQHITHLRSRLHIALAQQAEWDQFARVLRGNAKDMSQMLEQLGSCFVAMNGADQVQSYARIAQLHARDTQKLVAAFQALHGFLSDDQKRNANAIFRTLHDYPGRH